MKYTIEISFVDPQYGTKDQKVLSLRSLSPSLLEVIEEAKFQPVDPK
ncbi:hypothetical protein [Dubosiella newyorkensis]|nr:hypothetical protein [Dubosiella newyorkensis]